MQISGICLLYPVEKYWKPLGGEWQGWRTV